MKTHFAVLLITSLVFAPNVGFSRTKPLISSKHKRLLDDRLSSQYSASSKRFNISNPTFETIPRYKGNYKGKYAPMAAAAARKYGIPEDLFKRLVQQESNWNPRARSRVGAYGLAQLMPATARYLRVNPRDPKQNLEGRETRNYVKVILGK